MSVQQLDGTVCFGSDRTGMVLLCLSYSGDGGSFHPFMPVCMPDHSHAVCQNGPGTSDHWKPADHLLHF